LYIPEPLPVDPLISVVIAVRNESNNIERILEQVLEQDYPREKIEILVADGDSTDDTVARARAFPGGGAAIRALTGIGLGRAQGLNAAIRAATGSIIARLDARTRVDPDYFRRCLETLRATGAANVGGVQRSMATTPTQKAIGLALQSPFGVGDAQYRLGRRSGPVESLYLGFFLRGVFDEVGLFDEKATVISEDADMNERIRMAGGVVWLNHEINVYYSPRERISDLRRLYYRYGGARAGNFLKTGRLSWRQAVPPVFLLVLALGLAGAPFDVRVRVSWLAIIGFYLLADLAFSVRSGRSGMGAAGGSALPIMARLSVVFPTMHVAWAAGFLRRLCQRPKPGQYWGY
jgi:glycosyltransferase involved in cell wall biosynthesis